MPAGQALPGAANATHPPAPVVYAAIAPFTRSLDAEYMWATSAPTPPSLVRSTR